MCLVKMITEVFDLSIDSVVENIGKEIASGRLEMEEGRGDVIKDRFIACIQVARQ